MFLGCHGGGGEERPCQCGDCHQEEHTTVGLALQGTNSLKYTQKWKMLVTQVTSGWGILVQLSQTGPNPTGGNTYVVLTCVCVCICRGTDI